MILRAQERTEVGGELLRLADRWIFVQECGAVQLLLRCQRVPCSKQEPAGLAR
jgi:hypothetical protein